MIIMGVEIIELTFNNTCIFIDINVTNSFTLKATYHTYSTKSRQDKNRKVPLEWLERQLLG